MDHWVVATALFSALLHAAWNAAVKVHAEPRRLMAAAMVAAGGWSLPLLAFTGLPNAAAWPWIVASMALNMLAVAMLLRAYAAGPFGMVYATVRVSAVLAVVPLATWLAGERLPLPALAGVALVLVSLIVLGVSSRGGGVHEMSPRGWTLALATGLVAGLIVVVDAKGARAAGAGEPASHTALAYGAAVSVANAFGMACLQRRHGLPWRWPLLHAPLAWALALLSTASYVLIIVVYTQAPIALAAALRDTSALWALLIGALFLGEKLTPLRLLALVLALAGVPLMRLA